MTLPLTDERIWELRLQHVSEQVGELSKKIDDKLSGLAEVLKSVNENFVKILDDHEERLREQAKVDSTQAQEISTLRERIAIFSGELTAIKLLVEGINKRQEDRLTTENSEWKKIALKLLEYLLVAGASGGTVYAAKMAGLF